MHLIVILALFFITVNAMDNNQVTIRTQDGYMGIAKCYAREMKIFQACRSKNRYFLSSKRDEVDLLIDAIEASKKNKLKKFLISQSEDQRRTLLSAAYKFQATDLLALCTWHILLPDVREKIAECMMIGIKDTEFYKTMDRNIVEDYYDIGHFGIVNKKLCCDKIPCPDQTKEMRLMPIALPTTMGYADVHYCLEVFDAHRDFYKLNTPDESIDYLDWASNDVINGYSDSRVVCTWDLCLGKRVLSELDFLQWVFLYGLYQRVLSSSHEKLVLQKNSLKYLMYNVSPIFPNGIRKWIEQHMTLQIPISSGGCECTIL